MHFLFRLASIVFLIMLFGNEINAQGLDNLWMGGKDSWAGVPFGGSNIEFTAVSSALSIEYRDVDIYHTHANITDSLGSLLFYTNGVVVANHLHDTMQNGAGLNPSDYTNSWYPDGLLIYQANLIIPNPAAPNKYYLFHNTIDEIPAFTSTYIYLTEIDMNQNNGAGAVTGIKNQVLLTGDVQPGQLTAVKHGNGRDWWVYGHELYTNHFWRFLVDPSGVHGPFTQAVGTSRIPTAAQMVFTEDGSKFAYYSGDDGLDVFEVDRCTGEFSFLFNQTFDNDDFGIGASFSPSGRYVYVSTVNDVFQVDTDSLTTPVHIAAWDSTYSPSYPFATVFGPSKLAPDGKIYITTMNSTDKLHVINYPDSAGLACDLVQRGVTLPTYWKNSLPNHPNYHLGALQGSACDSLQVGVSEEPKELVLKLYPNPNNGSFKVNLPPQASNSILQVRDLNGRLIHEQGLSAWVSSADLSLENLRSGMYLLTLTNAQGAYLGKQRFVVE